MAYDSLSAPRIFADDRFFNARPKNLPARSGALSFNGPYKTFGQIHGPNHANDFSLNMTAGSHDSRKQSIGRPGHVRSPNHDPAASGFRPGSHPILYPGPLPQTPGHPPRPKVMAPEFPGDHFPSGHGNLQHQPGWGLEYPPITWTSFLQTSTSQRHFNNVDTLASSEEVRAAQPRSVKHLTCWYWANKGCKLPDHKCLYSHFDTGRLAEPPIQVQRGCPAVAGNNAKIPHPVYNDWKGHHQAHSAGLSPHIQGQITRVHQRAALSSTQTSAIVEQSEPADMVKTEGSSFAEPAADYNHAYPDDPMSPAPADSYDNMSTGIGASKQPIQQHFSRSPRHMGGQFLPPGPAAQHKSGWTHHGMGGHNGIGGIHGKGGSYGGMGGHRRMDGNGSSPQNIGGHNPNKSNASAAFGQSDGKSRISTEEMQKQMKVKDKVITELVGIVESLEINYGIAIDDQTHAFHNFVSIARSMEEEARRAGNAASSTMTKGKDSHHVSSQEANILAAPASNVPALSTSTPEYGHPPSNHERIVTAMEGSWNLINMEKMALVKSNARKQVVGQDLESIEASKLLPRGWIER